MLATVETGRTFMVKLPKGCDLIEESTRIATEQKITLGKVSAIGAVECAKVGFYHQDIREYEFFELEGNLEILSLMGNISLRDGVPMVHEHAVFGDKQGRAFGGHLAPGTRILVCETILEELTGTELNRTYDEPTGLPLWGG